jgi:peroxiredoxin Q/BCP
MRRLAIAFPFAVLGFAGKYGTLMLAAVAHGASQAKIPNHSASTMFPFGCECTKIPASGSVWSFANGSGKKKAHLNMLTEGVNAPRFKLPQAGGGQFDLAKHKGKIIVVYFYPKDDTSGCTKEAVDFSGKMAEFEALGAIVAGISPDSVPKHEKFRDKHHLTVTLAADEEKSVIEAYGVWVEKSMYGRKYMGVERSTFLVDGEGKIARIWRKVKVTGHADEVLEAVRALKAG